MLSHWIWRFVTGALLAAVCFCALFIPRVDSILLSVLVVLLLIGVVNAKISSRLLLYSSLLSVGLLFAFSLQSIFPQIRMSPYYLEFKLYRFFTLPYWFFVLLFLVVVFPGVDRWRNLMSSVQAQLLFKQRSFLMLILIGLVISQLLIVGSQMLSQGLYTLEYRSLEPHQRYAVRKYGVGESLWFYRVGAFWSKVIPNSSEVTVGIPPQGEPWIKSGNIYYVLYFLSPRHVEMLQSDLQGIPNSITHLVIARGETDQGDFGWPKIVIPKEKIAWMDLYNPFTLQSWRVENSDYNPEAYASFYGVIHLKREYQ